VEELEPPWWTPRKAAATRRVLSRETIVAAALVVLRAEGIDGLSMRRVAAELDTGAASLYAHVAHKDELLELLLDAVVADVPVPDPDPARWREQVAQLWTDCRAALAGNGDIARVALGRVPVGPHSLRIAEGTLALVRAGGVPEQPAAWAVDVIGMYVAANAVEGAVNRTLQDAGRDPAEYYAGVTGYFAALPPDRFPVMTSLGPFLAAGDGQERFAFGLRLLLDGLAATAGPRPAGP
jgi:AcrR family transcriptional regulator